MIFFLFIIIIFMIIFVFVFHEFESLTDISTSYSLQLNQLILFSDTRSQWSRVTSKYCKILIKYITCVIIVSSLLY